MAIGTLTFENCTLWDVLEQVPDQLKKKIETLGIIYFLGVLVDKVPEAVFHKAYQQASVHFTDEKTIGLPCWPCHVYQYPCLYCGASR